MHGVNDLAAPLSANSRGTYEGGKGKAMKIAGLVLALALFVTLGVPLCVAKVYLRWTESKLPAAKVLGVSEIVIPWSERASALLAEAKKQGYQRYVEVGAAQIADAVSAAEKANAAGIILRGEAAEHDVLVERTKQLRRAHPKLKVLVLSAHGKQPDMRGWLVFKKDGILQVSSPTSQPWLDANLAAIRYELGFESGVPLYSFTWDESDPLVKELGLKPADYALAIAEAGAYHADLLLEVHEAQRKGLLSGDKNTLEDWEKVRRYLDFYKTWDETAADAEARVCVLAEDYDASFEALNLMARHNIPFRVMKSSETKASELNACDVVIAFAELGKALTAALNEFAAKGGVVVLVKLHGPFPWEAAGAGADNGPSTTYTVGKGRVIALKGAITDPETFAQDVRRLLAKSSVPVSLWNSLTMLVAAYPGKRAGEVMVELVNYDEETTQVQVQVKGTFRFASLETPESGKSEKLQTEQVNGFTQFVVPELVVGGRVTLK